MFIVHRENMKNTLYITLCEFLVEKTLNSTISLVNATLYQIKSKHYNDREYLDFSNNHDKTLLKEYSLFVAHRYSRKKSYWRPQYTVRIDRYARFFFLSTIIKTRKISS